MWRERFRVSWRDVDVLRMLAWPHVWTPEVEEMIFPSRRPVSRNRVLGSRLQRLVGSGGIGGRSGWVRAHRMSCGGFSQDLGRPAAWRGGSGPLECCGAFLGVERCLLVAFAQTPP